MKLICLQLLLLFMLFQLRGLCRVFSVDTGERATNKGQRPNDDEVVVMTSDRKRKCSDSDDGVSVDSRRSCGDIVTVHVSSAVADTSSSAIDLLRPGSTSPAHGEPQLPARRPPTNGKYLDADDKLSCLPLGVVDLLHRNWNSVRAPRLMVEPSLCLEPVLPILLFHGSSCYQLSN